MNDLIDNTKIVESRFLASSILSEYSDIKKNQWLQACKKIEHAGYGSAVYKAYILHSVEIAELIGIESAIELSNIVSLVAIKSNIRTAEVLPAVALKVAIKFDHNKDQFDAWLNMIERLSKLAPESTFSVFEKMDYLLSNLTISKLEGWILAGIRSAGANPEKRLAYFSFKDPEAERWLEHESGSIVFSEMSRELKLYISALWGVHAPLREKSSTSIGERVRRSGFGTGLILVPSAFPGFRGDQADALFHGVMAHIGAHMIYSSEPSPVGELKPLQIALISLIEDARVEHLAMRDFPGLRRLWLPFHIAKAKGSQTANSLMARLSRALIDSDFKDENSWVCKAKKMFYERKTEWENPLISRQIGGLLANDLGQMRIQFNAKTYIVEPPYRDDNMGLWNFEDKDTSESKEAEAVLSAVDIQQQDESDPTNSEHQEQDEVDDANATPVSVIEEDGIPVARYPEYDYVTKRSRPQWTTIIEHQPSTGPVHIIDNILEQQAYVVNRIKSLITSTKISQPKKVRRQAEGDFLDIDACIAATISRRIGEEVDSRVYGRTERKHRDLSIHVLLDVSESTKDKVKGSKESVLDLERQATVLLAHAMAGVGDPFAISAFCSNQRDDIRYYRIKNFETPYDEVAKSNLAGLKGGGSTRLGAAMRHAAQDLKKQATHRRLLLVVTDGEPSDIDVNDPNYLVEDARHVIHELAMDGINAFGVGLDSGGTSYLSRIFGKPNIVQIDKIERLPEKLPMLYFRLTT